MPKAKRVKKKAKKLVLGDDAIESFEADWLDFRAPAVELSKQLYEISKSSGVCCGIVGPWGSGKSSFMKLMDENIRKEPSWKKVHIAWFTAWDPGGIVDLGDAMLYHFFRDVAGKSPKMADSFEELQEALGFRRSLRERARRAIEGVSEALPATGRAVTAVASGLLKELDAAKKIQRSFEKLMDWLEKENRSVFFFIDDIDRATGDQIRDLLSELKLYISHRRIVAVLAFDENYVLNALKSPVLPPGIDPKKYLEKIVTLRRNIPLANFNAMRIYAEHLIRSASGLHEQVTKLGFLAVQLSGYNPRRLKNIVLGFAQLLSPTKSRDMPIDDLRCILFISAVANMGFLAHAKVMKSLSYGDEAAFKSAITEIAEKDSSKSKDAEILIEALGMLELITGLLQEIRLSAIAPWEPVSAPIPRSKEMIFDWRVSFIPIVAKASVQGFKIPPKLVESSSEVVVVPRSTKTESSDVKYKGHPTRIRRNLRELPQPSCVLSWKQSDMLILLTSSVVGEPYEYAVRKMIGMFFDEIAYFVARKGFILWIIDDRKLLDEKYIKSLIRRAQEISKGLKNPFMVLYTPASNVAPLLEFLLSVTGAGLKT